MSCVVRRRWRQSPGLDGDHGGVLIGEHQHVLGEVPQRKRRVVPAHASTVHAGDGAVKLEETVGTL